MSDMKVVYVTREPSKGGRPKRITEVTKNEAVRLYNSGATCKDICRELHFSRSTFYKILKERQLQPELITR